MNAEEFRKAGKELIDYVADYLENIRDRPVLPSVQPFYIKDVVPAAAPETGEKWEQVFADLEKVVMNGFSSPACTELEMQMCDWMAKAIDLPSFYRFSSQGLGGGVIQGSLSDSTFVTLLAAKKAILEKIDQTVNKRDDLIKEVLSSDKKKEKKNFLSDLIKEFGVLNNEIEIKKRLSMNSDFATLDHIEKFVCLDKTFNSSTCKLVAYSSSQAHSSVEKAALLGGVTTHLVTPSTTDNLGLDGASLEKAIKTDLQNNLVPFFITATLGTTSTLAFDKLSEIGPIAKKYGLWLHVDAAYAGSAFICPEYRFYMNGIEFTDSFAINPHKWLMVNFDCSILWVKNAGLLDKAMNVSPAYLKHEKEGQIPDYRHWQVPLGRRFRSLKLWFVLRIYGIQGLQEHIRKQIALAFEFKDLIENNSNFLVTHPVIMGLVCFKLKGTDEENENLVNLINHNKRIHLMPTKINNAYVIRFAVCSRFTNSDDIKFAYNEILIALDELNSKNKTN